MPEESTTPDPEALARSIVEAANRRDFDAMLDYVAPDVVYDTSPSGFGIYQGVPAIRVFIEGIGRPSMSFGSIWRSFRTSALE
jgi:hypothetical protein